MLHFFEKRDPWGNGLALWVVVGMVFLIPIAVWGVLDTRMENEVHNWVASDNPQTKAFHWFEKHFPAEEAVLFTWEGSRLDDPRATTLVGKIRGEAGQDGVRRGGMKQIDSVRTPQELIDQMVEHDVPRDEAIQRLRGVMLGPGKLRVRLTAAGRGDRQRTLELLRQTAQEKFGLKIEFSEPEEALPLPVDAATTAAAEAETAGAIAAANPLSAAHDFQVGWAGMHASDSQIKFFREMALEMRLPGPKSRPQDIPLVEDCFLAPGAPIVLAITLSEAGMADRAAAFAALRAAAADVGIPGDKIHMGGRGVSGSALNQEVMKSLWNRAAPIHQPQQRSVIMLSGLVGGILAFWMLRSLRLAALVLGVSYFTTLICTALVPMTGGVMTMVLVVMPPLLLVTTLSGTIHLANYWKHAASCNPSTAVVEAVKVARSPCIWASVTTAIGLASLMTSSLQPVRDFGLYSAAGTIFSLGVILYGLPALLQLWPSRAPQPQELDHESWRHWGAWLVLHYKALLTGLCLASAVAIYGLSYFQTETKVIRYFADDAQIVRDYNYLEENLTGIVPVEVIVRFDQEAQSELKFLERVDLVRQIEARMRQVPDISGTLSLGDFLPAVAPPEENAKPLHKAKYAATSRTIEERVKGAQGQNAATLLTMARGSGEFNATGDELWRITAKVAIMSKLHYGTLTRQLDEICQSVLKKTAGQSDEKFRTPGTQVVYHPGASHLVTGMVPLFLATQEELLKSLINSFLLAFLTIAAVMMFLLRNPLAGLLAMVPNVLPIGAVFGLISWCGVAVDIGAIVTASIALGIAVDGTLHLITWFQLGIAAGKSRNAAVLDALGHCGPAMWQTSLVVGFSLLMLYPADLVLISRFGWLMAALIGTALVADITLTPVLLTGPLGMILQRSHRRRTAAAEPAAAVAAEPPQPSHGAHAPPAPHSSHRQSGARNRRGK